jgi:hypothetical protein
MALPFNPNTPQPNDVISQTQNPIQQNFASIGTAFNNGSNTFSQYAIQNVSAPGATVNPIAIFHSVLGVNLLVNQAIPYWRTSSGDYPMLPDLKSGGSNWGFKFGNIIFNFGVVAVGANITYQIPFPTTCSLAITPTSNSSLGGSQISYANIGSAPITGAKTNPGPPNGVNCTYMAIGF